jgi:hypothetical protein
MHRRMPEENAEFEIPKRVMMAVYAAFLALGIIIYISWGLMYNSWNIFDRSNLGIYSVTVVLCGFGAVGILLYSLKTPKKL